jgi:type IV secretion system protein VirB9
MKTIALPLTVLLLTCASPAFAAPDLPVDSRIKILTYSPQDVFTIPTKYGYQTSLVFAPNEEVGTVSVGDRSMWQIVPSGNRIFIRPMDDNLTTNMTVITNQREYNFDIKSVGENEGSNLYVVQFRYPDKKEKLLESVENTPPEPAPVFEPGASVNIPPLDTQRTQDMNRLYTYSGPDALAPAEVYDDGKYTYVIYNALPSPTPKPIVMSAAGEPAEAANMVEGNIIVIKTVVSGFVLSNPNGEVTVYNELFHSK